MKEDKKIKKSKKIGIFKENDEKRIRKMNIIATVESLYKFGRRLKMMKYTFPYFEIVEFEEEDIVVTSGLDNTGSGGGTTGGDGNDSGDFDW